MARVILLNMPIGDMADLTARVREVLQGSGTFAVEDSRYFREVLLRWGFPLENKRLLSFHDQSSDGKVERLLDVVIAGEDLYVASEAGSPYLADPAYPLVVAALDRGIEVQSYSGISAIIAALEVSGMPAIPFQFHSFLPREGGKVNAYISSLGNGTHVFFESPRRMQETLEIVAQLHPLARVCVVKELTKTWQDVRRGTASDWQQWTTQMEWKGEFVWLLHLEKEMAVSSGKVKQLAEDILSGGVGNKAVAKLLSEILGKPTKEIYSLLSKSAE